MSHSHKCPKECGNRCTCHNDVCVGDGHDCITTAEQPATITIINRDRKLVEVQPARPRYVFDHKHSSGRIVFVDGSEVFLQGDEAFHVYEQVEACAGPRADDLIADILNEYSEVAAVQCKVCRLWDPRGAHRCNLTPITLSNGTVVERERMDNGATHAFVRGRVAGELTNAEYVEALTILEKGGAK